MVPTKTTRMKEPPIFVTNGSPYGPGTARRLTELIVRHGMSNAKVRYTRI